MQKFKSKIEKHGDYDLVRRIESSAPNLGPFEYFEGPDFVCCSEVFNKPKPKLCEGLPNLSPEVAQVRCLGKGRPDWKPCQFTPDSNERAILFQPIRWRCSTPRKRKQKNHEPSLGSPIGLSKSSFGMKYLEGKSANQSIQGFATNLVAFAEYFITPEIEWDEKVLNRILLEGQNLYNDSMARLHSGEKLREALIKRTFTLCGNTFDLLVNDPFMMGQVIGQEAAVPNLHWGLLKFFTKFQFCLLQIEDWYTLLWKNADVYFLFDCFGRRYMDLQSDRKHGVAILICLRQIENISHLILNLSAISSEDFFIIRNMQVKSLVPCGGKPTPDLVDRSIEFEVISPDYAILRATIHLGSICFKEIRLRQSLPVAVCALINAKVDATATWNREVLDKIMKLGAHLYKQWTQCDVSINLGIHDVPNRFVFGQFRVEIAVNAIAECGNWKCSPNYRNSDLSQSLRRALQNGSNLLVQIQGRTYAIWKKGKFHYIFDPFAHRCSLERRKIITASLHMCGSLNKMCCIFTQSLLEMFEESKFVIHIVKILELEELELEESQYRPQVPCVCTAIQPTEGTQEVISLNESVIGVNGYVCQAEESPIESDSADLDSPGLSQTRLEDYTDMRRDFIEESDEETEDDEDDDIDLDSGSDKDHFEESDETDDEGASRQPAKEKKTIKKSKKPPRETQSNTKNRKEKSGSHLSDDAEATKTSKKKKEDKENKSQNKRKKESQQTLLKSQEKEDQPREKKKTDKKEIQKEKLNKPEIAEQEREKKLDHRTPNNEVPTNEDKSAHKSSIDKSLNDGNIINKQIEPEKPLDEIIDNQVFEEERNESLDSEPIDQDSPADQRKSKTSETPKNRDSTEISSTNKTTSAPTRRHQRHQRRKQQDGDDSSSSDEIPRGAIPVGCKPNSYPGFTEDPQNLAVIGSESGSYESLCNLLKSAFRCADRILTMTPWGNYVAFRSNGTYFVFDGCTCNLRSIRHMDLSVGTAGLLCFPDLHSLIEYLQNGKDVRKPTTFSKRDIVDQICSKYCSR